MNKKKINYIQSKFLDDYKKEESQRMKNSSQIWEHHKKTFRKFWKEKILNNRSKLTNKQMDEIIKILDFNARGKSKSDEAIAKINTYQGVWYKLFRGIKSNKELKQLLNRLFRSKDREQIQLLNEIKEICSADQVKYVVTKNSTMLNALMFAYEPKDNLSMVSLRDRYQLIDYFGLADYTELMAAPFGEKIIRTRNIIISLKDKFNLKSNRILCNFLYFKPVKAEWKKMDIVMERPEYGEPINFRGFVYGPVNHEGTVALFGAVAKDLGFNIEKVRKEYPDIEATYKGKKVNIEIEYLSSEFDHDPKKCDYIVCWKKSPSPCPIRKIIELKEVVKKLKNKEWSSPNKLVKLAPKRS